MFIDESGLSEQMHRGRTWAPRGETPVLPYRRLYPGSIKGRRLVEFLGHLRRALP